MPPKPKITKENVLKTALELTREKGYEYVSARSLAERLQCSTQPIFRIYKNMDMLKKDLFEYTNNIYFSEYLTNCGLGENPGLRYISFARTERNLFKMMFMGNNIVSKDFIELVSGSDNDQIIKSIPALKNLSEIKVKELFLKIWIFTHGIATMLCCNNIEMSDEEVARLMNETMRKLMS